MSKWLESLYDYLLKCRGVNKCPLAYVVRYKVAVKLYAIDPAIDDENVNKEMTSREPHDQYANGTNNKTRINMEQNGKTIAPYWIFLQEYCSPLKSRNRQNDMYNLKRFNQAGCIATTRRTRRLPSRSSFDASECVRPSRHCTHRDARFQSTSRDV